MKKEKEIPVFRCEFPVKTVIIHETRISPWYTWDIGGERESSRFRSLWSYERWRYQVWFHFFREPRVPFSRSSVPVHLGVFPVRFWRCVVTSRGSWSWWWWTLVRKKVSLQRAVGSDIVESSILNVGYERLGRRGGGMPKIWYMDHCEARAWHQWHSHEPA